MLLTMRVKAILKLTYCTIVDDEKKLGAIEYTRILLSIIV